MFESLALVFELTMTLHVFEFLQVLAEFSSYRKDDQRNMQSAWFFCPAKVAYFAPVFCFVFLIAYIFGKPAGAYEQPNHALLLSEHFDTYAASWIDLSVSFWDTIYNDIEWP